MNGHNWKTPQMPRGMPPSAWPQRRRELYVEAIERGDADAPRPHHPPGQCEECEVMRRILAQAAEARGVPVALLRPAEPAPFDGEAQPPEKPTASRYRAAMSALGNLKLYPGALALLLGLFLGATVCALAGLLIALLLGVTLLAVAIIAAY